MEVPCCFFSKGILYLDVEENFVVSCVDEKFAIDIFSEIFFEKLVFDGIFFL